MRINLVFPPFYLEPMYNLPPLGLVNLATALKETPHEVSCLDFVLEIRTGGLKLGPHIYDDCAERILSESPDLVGFSAQCTTYPAVLQICRRLKARRRDLNIVLGGHNAAFADEWTLEGFPEVDAVVRGEGERTFCDLVAQYAAGGRGEGVEGVTWRDGGRVMQNPDRDLVAHLDALPYPDYGFLPPLEVYRRACNLPRSIAILEAGRGCPHRCVYCSESLMWRGRVRTYSVERLVGEMEKVHRLYGAECFLLAYDQFTATRSFVEGFCRLVLERGLERIPWYCISRLDSVDRDLLALMREAGCESMCYGIDSGSKKTLAFIRKRIDHGILYQRVVETAEQGIIPTLSFVIGFPEEEKEDVDATLTLALRGGIVGNNNPLIQLPTVLPGTELHARYADRLVREVDTYFALGLEFDGGRRLEADEAMIDAHPLLFSSFYNLPTRARPLAELNAVASYFPLMVRLLPKTFLLLGLEVEISVSDLFMDWLEWLRLRTAREAWSLSPQDCYRHFEPFVLERLGSRKTVRISHLKDILKYEMLSLEAGKHISNKTHFDIDLNRLSDLTPKRDQGIVIGRFDFDLPVIIIDLKSGIFDKVYQPQETLLAFRQEDDMLEVNEINAFGRDFLALCDGGSPLETIARELYDRYGQGMTREGFMKSCEEALEMLARSHLVEFRS